MSKTLDPWAAASRAYLEGLLGIGGARLDGYLAAERRMDARSARNCGTGYACGSTCISREKVCRVRGSSAGLGRLQALATMTTATGRQLHGPNDRAAQLLARRDALVADALTSLQEQRGDGTTAMEKPGAGTLAMIEQVGRSVLRIDRELNAIDGRPALRRRWQAGTPGLDPADGAPPPPHPPTQGRQAYREKIVSEAIAAGSTKGLGKDGRPLAIVTMGGPGSGKSTLRNQLYGSLEGMVNVDPDGVKERLPEYALAVAVSDKRAAFRAHNESSLIADQIQDRAIEGRYNVIIDGTGKNGDKYERMILDLKTKGYEVRVIMPHLSVTDGVQRVAQRANRSGRYVPKDVVTDIYEKAPRNFERMGRIADHAVMVDSAAGNTTIMEYRGGSIVQEDGPAAARFRQQFGGGR